jgi:hypothetical protein
VYAAEVILSLAALVSPHLHNEDKPSQMAVAYIFLRAPVKRPFGAPRALFALAPPVTFRLLWLRICRDLWHTQHPDLTFRDFEKSIWSCRPGRQRNHKVMTVAEPMVWPPKWSNYTNERSLNVRNRS